MFCLSCSGRSALLCLSCSVCPVAAALFWLSCGCPLLAGLFLLWFVLLSCYGYLILDCHVMAGLFFPSYLAGLFLFSCFGCPVLAFMLRQSCAFFHVMAVLCFYIRAVLFWLSYGCPVLAVLFLLWAVFLLCMAVLFLISCYGFPVFAFILWQYCSCFHDLAVLFLHLRSMLRQSSSCFQIMAGLFLFSYQGCSVLTFILWLSCSCFHVVTVLFLLLCYCSPVLAMRLRQLVLALLLWLFLFLLSCYGCPVLASLCYFRFFNAWSGCPVLVFIFVLSFFIALFSLATELC